MKAYPMYLIICGLYLSALAFATHYLGASVTEMFNSLKSF